MPPGLRQLPLDLDGPPEDVFGDGYRRVGERAPTADRLEPLMIAGSVEHLEVGDGAGGGLARLDDRLQSTLGSSGALAVVGPPVVPAGRLQEQAEVSSLRK